MEAQIDQIPQRGQIDLTIHVSATMNYSAEAARKIVGRFAANEISYLLRADTPSLLISEQVCWRVPLSLALPHHGEIGVVGSVDVAVETGEFQISPEQIQDIMHNANQQAAHYSTAGRSAP